MIFIIKVKSCKQYPAAIIIKEAVILFASVAAVCMCLFIIFLMNRLIIRYPKVPQKLFFFKELKHRNTKTLSFKEFSIQLLTKTKTFFFLSQMQNVYMFL